MINTRDYFGRPLYLAGTPQPYQPFAPIGEYQRRSSPSPSSQLTSLFDSPQGAAIGAGNGAGAGSGTGTGTGAGSGSGTGTTPDLGSGPGPQPPPQQPSSGPSAWDLANIYSGIFYGADPTQSQPGDAPRGYPTWDEAQEAWRWEIANNWPAIATGGGISADNPHQPDYQAYPGASGGTGGTPTTGGGGSTGGGSTGGGSDETPQFGIGGAIGGYPGVWTPDMPTSDRPSGWDVLDSAGTIWDIFNRPTDEIGRASDLINEFVAGPGSTPPPVPTGVSGELGAFADKVGDAAGLYGLGKTLLDGDASGFDKTMAAVSYAFPALGAAYTVGQLLGVGGGESSKDKEQRGYSMWDAVNTAYLDALGRDAAERGDYYSPHISSTNLSDLNFLNAFLDSKDLRWGEGEYKPFGVKGGELIDMYGNDIDRLWGDLTSFYGGYENAPQPGDVESWRENYNRRIGESVAQAGGPTAAFLPGTSGDFYRVSDTLQDLLKSSQGDPAQNQYYNPYLTRDVLAEYAMNLAFGPSDTWGYNARDAGRESGAWSWW